MKEITDDILLGYLRALPDNPEDSHAAADELLCAALRQFGFWKSIAFYDKMRKWYA